MTLNVFSDARGGEKAALAPFSDRGDGGLLWALPIQGGAQAAVGGASPRAVL